MRHLSRWMPVLAAIALIAPSSSAAQDPPADRKGIWITAGAGLGSAGFRCDSCPEIDRQTGPTGVLRVGGAVGQKLLVGVEFLGWKKDTIFVGNVLAAAYLYPTTTSPLFLKLGGGFSWFASDGGPEVGGLGGAVSIGVGYNLRVSSRLSLTGVADVVTGDVDDLDVNGIIRDAAFRQNLFHIGVGVTFH